MNSAVKLRYSALASDPDLADLVEMFVEEIPARIAAMQAHFENEDWKGLLSLAHQLKGAAGSYGFADITPLSRNLELACRDLGPGAIRSELDCLREACDTMRSGVPE